MTATVVVGDRAATGVGRVLGTSLAAAMAAASWMMGGGGAMAATTMEVAGGMVAPATGDRTTGEIAGARRTCMRKKTTGPRGAYGPVLIHS
jgi:hypothetical protein